MGSFLTLTLTLTLTLFLLFLHADAKNVVVPEHGYTVTTILDGNKLNINPYAVLQRPGSSDLLLLDSSNSTFYTLRLPISQDSVFTRFSGDGSFGYSDGDVGSARFNKPKSFAFDLRGNIYVADKFNHVIRKITSNGVTTIAGRFSEKSRKNDGPALNATFSNDFDLTFIPGLCALMVSDHQHHLVRQINLKEDDCTLGSKSGLGAVMTWTLGLGLSCLLGIVIGIVVRPYVIPNIGSNPCHFITTWKHCPTHLGRITPTLFFGVKSAVASCSFSSVHTILMKLLRLILSYLLLIINIVSPRPHLESVSLLDFDAYNSGEVTKSSSKYPDQLKDLLIFDEDLVDSTKTTRERRDGSHEAAGIMIKANMGFVEAPKDSILHQELSVCNLGIVKRR
ncbi:hypothetical protein RJT34_01974 [Clitoria ternatea]|uniref:NHL repeat-containing protein n=1 Tax=Clitoria ternatea TaxID=43366 RepID=A0AAN9Q042_CLITE